MVAHCVCVFSADYWGSWLPLSLHITTIGLGSVLRDWDTKEEGKQRAVRTCVSLGRTWLAHSELGMVSQGTRGVGTLCVYCAEITWGPWKILRLAESREKVVHRSVCVLYLYAATSKQVLRRGELHSGTLLTTPKLQEWAAGVVPNQVWMFEVE